MDSGFYTGHDDLSNTTITQTGQILAATGQSSSDDHGAIVTELLQATTMEVVLLAWHRVRLYICQIIITGTQLYGTI